MGIEDVARRIVADNQRARERGSSAFRALTDQLTTAESEVDVDAILKQLRGNDGSEKSGGDDSSEGSRKENG